MTSAQQARGIKRKGRKEVKTYWTARKKQKTTTREEISQKLKKASK